MAERHPSRTLLLRAATGRAERSRRRAVDPMLPGGRSCRLRRGDRARRCAAHRAAAPASIALPLLISDLPGVLPVARRAAVRVDARSSSSSAIIDRLIVDSTEWDHLPGAYAQLAEDCSSGRAVSDIAWARTERWRIAARVAVAGHRGRAAPPRPRHAGAGVPPRGLAPLASRPRRRGRHRRARAAGGHRPRRRARPVPAGRPAEPQRRPLGRARPSSRAPGLRAGCSAAAAGL